MTAHDEDEGGDATAFVEAGGGGVMTAVRVLVMLAGFAAGLYGAWLIWEFPPVIIIRIAVWAGAGVAIHDFVFAPLCAAFGFAGRRLVRGRWWKPVSVAALCTAILALLAIPVYSRPGARPDNMTVLNRDYPLGLWISIAIVWACVPVYYLAVRRLPVRQDEVVEQEGTDDVEAQPQTP
jgi:NADH:ubiquinone oxidoreductase subunit 6 (subunit J)